MARARASRHGFAYVVVLGIVALASILLFFSRANAGLGGVNVTPTPSARPPSATCNGVNATIVGTAAANRLVGTPSRDVIAGLGGNDSINGGGGNDLICGGAGADTMNGADGRDTIYGNTGNDHLNGGAGASDRCFGGAGYDRVRNCEGGTPSDNHAPVARNNGPFNTVEDVSPIHVNAPGILGNDSDADGPAPLTALLATGPLKGTLTLNPNGSFDYGPAPNTCGADSFTYRARDGRGARSNLATVRLSVTCVNDQPSFTDAGDQTAAQDDAAQTVAGWASALNPGPLEGMQTMHFLVTNNSNPALFSAGPSVSSNGTLTFTPTPGANGLSTITVVAQDNGGTANGGVDTSVDHTFTITIAARPVVDLNGVGTDVHNTASFTEGGGSVALAPIADVTDADDTHLESAEITLTNDPDTTDESLSVTIPGGNPINVTAYDSGTGILALDGTATLQQYEDVLRLVSYDNTSDDPSTANRSVEFTVNDGLLTSLVATSDVTVNAVNDAPVLANPGATTVSFTEGDAATPVYDSTLTVTDPDNTSLASATVQITANYDNTADVLAFAPIGGNPITTTGFNTGTGTLPLAGPATLAQFEAALEAVTFENTSEDPSGPNRTVSAQVDDGAALNNLSNIVSRDVSVTPVNDAPELDMDSSTAGIDSTAAFVEDSPAVPLAATATVSDVDDTNIESATITLTNALDGGDESITVDTTGTGVVAAGSGTHTIGLSGSRPKAEYEAVIKTLKYDNTSDAPDTTNRIVETLVNDGDVDSATADTTVTVAATNDGPSITAPASIAVQRDISSNLAGISVADADSGSDDIELKLKVANGDLTVDTTVAGGVTVGQVTGNTTAEVTLTAPRDAINATLADANGVSYLNDVGFALVTDDLDVDVSDLGNNGAGGAQTDHADVTIQFNQPPVLAVTTTTASFTEDAGPVAVAPDITVTDADDTDLESATITLTNRPDGSDESLAADTTGTSVTAAPYVPGSGVLALSGTDTLANYQAVLRSVEYDNSSDTPDTANRLVDFQVNDGSSDSNTVTNTVTVAAANDAPTVALGGGASIYTENDAATTIASADVHDVDDTNLEGATVSIQSGCVTGDVLTLSSTPAGINNGGFAACTLTLTGSATIADYETALSAVTYHSTSEDPTNVTRQIRFTANDGDDTGFDTRNVSVTPVNDAPVVNLDASGALIYAEQAGYQNLFGAAATITDPDNSTLASLKTTVTTGFDSTFDDLRLNPLIVGFTSNFTGGELTLTKAGGTVAEYQTALRNVQFANTDDDPDDRNDGTANPSVADRTVSVVANDGTDPSTAQTRNITITPTNDAPSAPSPLPSASSIRNTTLAHGTACTAGPKVVRTIGLEGNSTDPDGLEANIEVVPVTSAATAQSGRITLTSAGDLCYEPPASVTLSSDTYDYQLTDGTTASSAITFTANLAGEVWYVADEFVGTEDGTSARPFNTVAEAIAASTTNDAIHIRRAPGDGTLTAGITMQSGQKLIGEGVALTNVEVGTGTSETLFAAGTKPVLTASGTDVVALADNAEVAGVSINPDGAASGLAAATGTSGVTLRTMEVNDTGTAATQTGIEFLGSGNGLTLSGAVDVAMASTRAIDITGAVLSGTFTNVTTTASSNGGVFLTNTTGGLDFGNLVLTTTSSTAAALQLNNIVDIDVDGPSFNATITASGGPAVDVTNMDSLSSLVFDSVSSTNSASDGIRLDNAAGTFTALAGSITNAGTVSGQDVDISGNGSGDTINFTYDGTITDDLGQLVNVSNQVGGTKDFNGAITDGNDGDGSGISLSSNSGSTTRFDGGLTLSTGGNPAFAATGPGPGAGSGGTVVVTDPNAVGTAPDNTIVTTSGVALNVANTTIGANDLNFKSISSNGATNGILVSNTGAEGLTVAGTGGAGTGGTIASSTSAGVSLTSTGPVSLSSMNVQNGADDGIRGSNVNGLTLTGMSLTTNGNAVGERGIDLFNLTGSGGIATSTISGSGEGNVRIENDTPTALTAFNVTASTISTTNMTTGDDGFLLLNDGSGAMAASITGSTFTDNKGDHFQAASDADATGPIDVTFNNNVLSTTAGNDANVLGGGITLNTSGTVDLTFDVLNNNIQQAFDDAINMNLDPGSLTGASFIGTVSGNTIGTAGVPSSGSESSHGITMASKGGGTSVVAITNNTIREWGNEYGIYVALTENEGDPGKLDATVTGNSLKNPGTQDPTFPLNGLHVQAGATATDVGNVLCAAISGNDVTGSGANAATDIRLRQRFGTTIKLPGYGGTTSDTTAVNAFVQANNTGAPSVSSIHNVGGGGGGYVGGTCATP